MGEGRLHCIPLCSEACAITSAGDGDVPCARAKLTSAAGVSLPTPAGSGCGWRGRDSLQGLLYVGA